HGAAVDLDREMAACAIGKRETERKIRHERHFVVDTPMRERNAQGEWIPASDALIGEGSDQLGGVNELHVGASAGRALQADIEVHDLQLVLDERPPGLAVLAAPFDVGEFDTVALYKQARAAVGECIDHRSGPDRIEVELGARAVNVAGVEKAMEAVIGAVERAA